MLRYDKTIYLSLLFNSILSERLGNSPSGSDVLLFLEFINIVLILFYDFIEFITLLYTFLIFIFSMQRFFFLIVQELLIIFEAFV